MYTIYYFFACDYLPQVRIIDPGAVVQPSVVQDKPDPALYLIITEVLLRHRLDHELRRADPRHPASASRIRIHSNDFRLSSGAQPAATPPQFSTHY